MSDLGAIFHVKKDGTQYDAHAYTTTDECPTPNLKIKTKDGTQAYVKLTDNGSGDVPLRVKPKSGSTTYQVIANAVPTGSKTWTTYNSIQLGSTYKVENYVYINKTMTNTILFTVPAGVKVLQIVMGANYAYVGVTPNKTYELGVSHLGSRTSSLYHILERGTYVIQSNTYYLKCVRWNGISSSVVPTISWSPEINKQTPTVTDY